MRNFVLICTLLSTALLVFSSCKNQQSRDSFSSLQEANQAMQANRYAKAQEICNNIFAGDSLQNLGPGNLCNLSLLFINLAEISQTEEENTAKATICIRQAYRCDSDSTMAFIRNLNIEDQSKLSLISALGKATERTTAENGDTIFYDDSSNHEINDGF